MEVYLFKNIIYHRITIIKISLSNILFILGISYTEPRTPQKEARIDILCFIFSHIRNRIYIYCNTILIQ